MYDPSRMKPRFILDFLSEGATRSTNELGDLENLGNLGNLGIEQIECFFNYGLQKLMGLTGS